MSNRVLITGCAGFIGSHLVDACLSEGWMVDGVDNMWNGQEAFLPCDDSFTFLKGHCFTSHQVLSDIRDGKYLTVFHLAAIPRVSYSWEQPFVSHHVNVELTMNLIEECTHAYRKPRFVFASSSSVYGNNHHVSGTDERNTLVPLSPYALQKRIIEDYLRLLASADKLESVSLRFFNVFGPRSLGSSPYATALGSWLTAIKEGRPMRSDGDGKQSRDLCYVSNVVDACIRAAKRIDPFYGDAINVACGKSTTNEELLEFLMLRYPTSNVVNAPERAGDVKHTLASIDKAKEELGYTPSVDVWEGVKKTCDWYDANWDWVKGLKLKT